MVYKSFLFILVFIVVIHFMKRYTRADQSIETCGYLRKLSMSVCRNEERYFLKTRILN